ncbi:MAG: hypothetical protein K2W95_21320 [Candidatus Obscuribacterales bacterium]|nr:hypothetical protein [Candidatus Obscuribacterales bacterium]
MSWWQNPGLPGISVDPSAVKLPLELELVPEAVFATVDHVQFKVADGEHLDCWTYLTKGLTQFGQKEILFALKQEPGQNQGDFPGAPLDFFRNICQYVVKGEYLDAGSITIFGDSGFLSGKFRAMGYIQPPAVSDVNAADNTLWAMLIMPHELEAARLGGLSRVMALLGRNDLHFPCPLWNDLNREEVVTAAMLADMGESPIAQFPRMPLHVASVSRFENKLKCVIPLSALENFSQLQDLDEEIPMTLLTGLDSSADGFLVWQSDASTPLAITAPGFPGNRLGGAFLCFVPEQDNDLGLISEDGFAYSLTMETWRKLRQSLINGRSCTVKASGNGLDLDLEWTDDREVKELLERRAAKPEKVEPASCAPPEFSSVAAVAKRIEFGTHEIDIARSLDPALLSGYITRLADVVREHFFYQGPSEGFDLIVECLLKSPEDAEFQVSSQPVMEPEDEIALADRLSLTYPPVLKEGQIQFKIDFSVWGGAGALPYAGGETV